MGPSCENCGSELVTLHGRTETRKNLTWCSKCDNVYREGVLLVEPEKDATADQNEAAENKEKPKRASRPAKKSATK